jgi:hypothetical protein
MRDRYDENNGIERKSARELKHASPLHEDDPELEREYRMMAELFIDIYFWKQEQQHKSSPQDQVDTLR